MPAGAQAAFNFIAEFDATNANGVTLVPSSAVSLSLDGVPQDINPDSSGLNPGGTSILIEGTNSSFYKTSFIFQTLTIGLDYSVDGANTPIVPDDVSNTLSPTSRAYVVLGTETQNFLDQPSITLVSVPQPASLGLLAVGSLGLLKRRALARRSRV